MNNVTASHPASKSVPYETPDWLRWGGITPPLWVCRGYIGIILKGCYGEYRRFFKFGFVRAPITDLQRNQGPLLRTAVLHRSCFDTARKRPGPTEFSMCSLMLLTNSLRTT